MPRRYRLPSTRPSITHRVEIRDSFGGIHDVYLIVGLYSTSRKPGEIFIKVGKQGSTLRGLLDAIGVQTSLHLQYKVPLGQLCAKMRGMSFEPAGHTDNPEIPTCVSIVDYIFTWLEKEFG